MWTCCLREKSFYTQSFYTENSLQGSFSTHKNSACRRFYTQNLLYTGAFPQRSFETGELKKRSFCSKKLLHTRNFIAEGALQHRSVATQELLHRGTFTHRRVCAEKPFILTGKSERIQRVKKDKACSHKFSSTVSRSALAIQVVTAMLRRCSGMCVLCCRQNRSRPARKLILQLRGLFQKGYASIKALKNMKTTDLS